jgi:L-aminopeptidase/D-esterase-like protein
VALALYDLAVGDPSVRPGPAEGYTACEAAADGPVEHGQVGAGAGATVAKWRGREHARDGGLGGATLRHGEVVVAALVAVNAVGDLRDGDEPRLATAPEPFENTTIGVVVTNATLDKQACLLAAQSGHDGLARALSPAHARGDGDALVAAATGTVEAGVDTVRELAATAVERAIRTALGPH